MKKMLVVLMMMVSMVAFGKRVVISYEIEPGDEIHDSDFKVYIVGFDSKHPEGYNTGLKSMIYLKHKGKTYKEIDYGTLKRVLSEIGYTEYNF